MRRPGQSPSLAESIAAGRNLGKAPNGLIDHFREPVGPAGEFPEWIGTLLLLAWSEWSGVLGDAHFAGANSRRRQFLHRHPDAREPWLKTQAGLLRFVTFKLKTS